VKKNFNNITKNPRPLLKKPLKSHHTYFAPPYAQMHVGHLAIHITPRNSKPPQPKLLPQPYSRYTRTTKTPRRMQKLQDYPITTITNTKQSKRKDKFGTTKMFTSYKCTWAQPENQNYSMWMTTDKAFPHNKPNIANHNLILLKQFYLTKQHNHYSNIIEKNFHQLQ
jgi:hypothetical protein